MKICTPAMVSSFIISACRTPIGSLGGSLSFFRAPELGAIVIKEAVKRAGLKPEEIEEVVMGCVLTAGLGQAPARQAAILAGLPKNVGALTVNKVCSSGLAALMQADRLIQTGECNVAVAGGMESMSNAPYLLPKARFGYRLGDGKVIDSMVIDGLWDVYNNIHMGSCAELCAKEFKISRGEQDQFTTESYKKAMEAQQKRKFDAEIINITFVDKKEEKVVFKTDEEVAKVQFDKIPKLKSVFEKDGTVTAAGSSSISDGAAACVVASEAVAKKLNLKPMARIVAHAGHSQEPEWFTTAPVGAVQKVLKKAGLKLADIDLIELNEAFAAQSLAVITELKLDSQKVNVNGGAVALGHPIGCSGARIVVTLIHALKDQKKKRGLATLCNGGGEATAMIIEAL